jgi:hypothetical protein
MAGHWVQAYLLHGLVAGAGGTLSVETGEDRVAADAVLPG